MNSLNARLIRISFPLFALVVCMSAGAEVIRDYYSEPGINPFKETLNQAVNEHIDPFSGALQLSYVDMMIPGNGGLDIKIRRTYTSLQESVGLRTVTGVGWTIHFGRIVVNAADAAKICSQGSWSTSVTDNPSLEFPGGGRELLTLATDPNAYLMTRSRWKAECVSGREGLTVTAPNGTQYIMDQYEYVSDGQQAQVSWYTSQIRDTNGNTIDIAYKTGGGYTYIDRISASDGRSVQFAYVDEGTPSFRLHTITANGQIWEYLYTDIPEVPGSYKQLTEVIRPDGTRWQYQYYPMVSAIGSAGSFSLKQLTYPYGGSIAYTYKPVYFDPADDTFPTTVVASKRTAGPDVTTGTWTFDYSPAISNPRYLDITTVHAPDGKYVYYHYGYSNTYSGQIWSIGLLLAEEVYDNSGVLIQQEVNDWAYQAISLENYWHGRNTTKIDNETVAPILTKKTIWRQEFNFTTEYRNYDGYGNPGQVIETGNIVGDDTKTTNITYHVDPARWIINLPEDESIVGIGTIDRAYDSAGNLLSENKYGVQTTYTYTPQGDINTATDAGGNVTTYLGYYRGTAQQVNHPEGVTTRRVVNPTGTVASVTNGRGFITRFSYDGLNRLTGIDYPIHADVSIAWSDRAKTLTRGTYEEKITLDGFGHPEQADRRDTARGILITTTTQYDALGRKIFGSYPNSTEGTSYHHDVLGRITRIDHPDGTYKTYSYLSGGEVKVRNERGFDTSLLYRSYGNPDERHLVVVRSPENITTDIHRNILGQIMSVWQGETGGSGYARTYHYDNRYFLVSIDNPETGSTVLGRDAIGNLTSRQVGSSGVTYYAYDALNRLVSVDYPSGTSDVVYAYDGNSNPVSVTNGESQRAYTYDENDNLTMETVTIGGVQYNVGHQYDANDFSAATSYPSGRQVNYAPDALGRPTQAAPYLAHVGYHPSGQVRQMVYANGEQTDFTLNNRLRVDRIHTHGAASAVDLQYAYDANGNVVNITDVLEPTYNRSLGYDGMDRLAMANGAWGTGSFTYDKLGNIVSQVLGNSSLSYAYQSNRLAGVTGSASYAYGYDHYGNVSANGRFTFNYDDAGNLLVATLQAAGVPVGVDPSVYYGYDGDNMRVRRTHDAVATHYVYARGGNLLGEYDHTGNPGKEYFYLGSTLIASVAGNPDPVANAGPDQTVQEGTQGALDGSASSAVQASISGYSWRQTAGPAVTLNNAITATPSFSTPVGVYNAVLTFELTVTDSRGSTATDQVSVSVQSVDTDSDGLSDFWENQFFGNLNQTAGGDIDGDGFSNLQEFRAGTDPTVAAPLAASRGFMATPGIGQNTLVWKPVDRALSYDVYWSTQPGVSPSTGTLIGNVQSPYTHTGLSNGQTYYYILVARNICCESQSRQAKATPGMSGWTTPVAPEEGQYVGEPILGGYVVGHVHAIWSEIKLTGTSGYDTTITAGEYVPGQGWSAGVVLARASINDVNVGEFVDTPTLRVSPDGSMLAAWVRTLEQPTAQGGRSFLPSIVVRRYVPGQGWGAAQTLVSYTTTGWISGTQIRFDQSGNAIVIWSTNNAVYATRYTVGSGWGAVETVVAPQSIHISSLQLVVAPSGQAAIGFIWSPANVVPTPSRVSVSRYTLGQGWTAPEIISSESDDALRLALAADDNGNFWAAWTDRWSGVFARRYVSGVGWEAPQRIGANLGWGLNIRLAPAPNGNVLAVWSRIGGLVRIAGVLGRLEVDGALMYNRYVAGTGWGRAADVPSPAALIPGGCGALSYSYDLVRNSDNEIHLLVYGYANLQSVGTLDYRFSEDGQFRAPDLIQPLDGGSWYDSPDVPPYGAAGQNNSLFALWELDRRDGRIWGSEYVHISGSPHARAGANQAVDAGTLVTLDGSTSTDAEGPIVSYRWRQITGSPVTLSSADVANPSFTAPAAVMSMCGVYPPTYEPLVFELRVIDADGLIGSDTVSVVVEPADIPPTANAGPDQIVNEGDVVYLDGSGSVDTDGTIGSYIWEAITSPYASIPGGVTASFTAPQVQGDQVMTVELTVYDDQGKLARDTVNITIKNVAANNQPPVVSDPGAQASVEGTSVNLAISASDADGDTLSYSAIGLPPGLSIDAAAGVISGTVGIGGSGSYTPSVTVTDGTAPVSIGFAWTVTPPLDTVAPVVTAPPLVTAEATGPATAVSLGTATAVDNVDGALTPTPDDPGPFAVGTHTITWSATDAAGNTGSATQTVVVQDTTPPVLTLPANVTTTTGSTSPVAVDIGQATATDLFAPVTVSNDAPGGFREGSTVVTWTATDTNGNSGSGQQLVRVIGPNTPSVTRESAATLASPTTPMTGARNVTVVGSMIFFVAADSTQGAELWVSDGTVSGTHLVKDIVAGAGDANPEALTPSGGLLYFLAEDGAGGKQIWRSDGTATGTVSLGAVNPASHYITLFNNSLFVTGFPTTVAGSAMYFLSDDGVYGVELWKYDGVSSTLVKDINPGAGSSWPTNLMAVGGTLYFAANDGTNGYELWKSDGTAVGTVLVKDINPGAGSSYTSYLTPVGNMLYFTAYDGASGYELWRSDGTGAGTVQVADLWPGAGSSLPNNLAAVNGTVYFAANDGTSGYELWKSDGTAAGTVQVADLWPGAGSSLPNHLTAVGSKLYFAADDGIHGQELWATDGTGAGLLKDLWRGTPASNPELSSAGVAGDVVYFAADDGVNGRGLWMTTKNSTPFVDGDADGMEDAWEFAQFGNLDAAATDDPDGDGLSNLAEFQAATDPNSADTDGDGLTDAYEVSNHLDPTTQDATEDFDQDGLSNIDEFGRGTLPYNRDSDHDGAFDGEEVAAGTNPLQPDDPALSQTAKIWGGNPPGSNPSDLATIGDTLFFTLQTSAGRELWVSDGTVSGTHLVKDIVAGAGDANPEALTPSGGLLYFLAEDGAGGKQIWSSDGTATGTVSLGAVNPASHYITLFNNSLFVTGFPTTVAGSAMYFLSDDGVYGVELWKYDGVSSTLVKDINPGAGSSWPTNLMAVGGTLYFAANDGTNGYELWKSDGTAVGTVLVKDINPGAGSSYTSYLTPVGNMLYFTAYDGASGYELWRSDGTGAGTVQVADLWPGAGSSLPNNLATVNGTVYFAANDGTSGYELWKSDGTAAGTVQVADLWPGAGSSLPNHLTAVGSKLYFAADDGIHGQELWATDGTGGGSSMIKDMLQGLGSSLPDRLTVGTSVLYFIAEDVINGREVWRTPW